MVAVYEEAPFSEFLHRPAAAAERLDRVRALRLRRRDAGDLALMRADQLERDGVVVDFTARLLAGLLRTQPVDAVRAAVRDALPWSTFLPEPAGTTLHGMLRRICGERLKPSGPHLALPSRQSGSTG